MESTALTFNLNEEPYSNPGAVLRKLSMDPYKQVILAARQKGFGRRVISSENRSNARSA